MFKWYVTAFGELWLDAYGDLVLFSSEEEAFKQARVRFQLSEMEGNYVKVKKAVLYA